MLLDVLLAADLAVLLVVKSVKPTLYGTGELIGFTGQFASYGLVYRILYSLESEHVSLNTRQYKVVRTVFVFQCIIDFVFFADCPMIDEALLSLILG